MSPERLSSSRPRLVESLLLIMAAGVLFLSGFVVYALVVGDPNQRRIEGKVDRSISLLNDQVRLNRAVASSSTCVSYQNHRAIERSLIDIAKLNMIASSPPRVLPSKGTLEACRAVNIEINDKGVPELSPAPGGTPEAEHTAAN